MRVLAVKQSPKRLFLLGGFVIAVAVGVTYYSALKIGFWSDDYAFVEVAARLPLLDYLVWYFDPRVQALWYRPIPGMLWWVEWQIFRGNPLGYHLVYILLHMANSLLLYTLVARVTKEWLPSFASALAYAGFNVYSLAVLRPSDETTVATFFYLLTILFWLNFLAKNNWRYYVLAYFSFILALFSKEASVTLPVMLFLVDRLLVGEKSRINLLLLRYLPFALVVIPYLAFEFTWLPDSQYKINLGYGLGFHMFSILGEYLTRLVFPWGLNPPANYGWLSVVVLVIAFIVIKRRERRWSFLALGALVTLAPYIPFQFVFLRFLYLPMMFSAMAVGASFAWVYATFVSQRWHTVLLMAGLGYIPIANGVATMNDIDGLDRFAREGRWPLRTVSQWHPNLPKDTFLYFIDPPVPLYSGMFFLRYGPQVSVGGDIGIYKSIWRNVVPQPARLRDHNVAYVFYFDDNGQMREQGVRKEDEARISPQPPVDFDKAIQLEGYEIASATVKHTQAIVVLLYWRATRQVNEDYTVFAHLVNAEGITVAGSDSQPRNGKSRTSSWRANEPVADWIIIPISDKVPAGANYQLEFGLYDQPTMKRLPIVDPNGTAHSDRVVIEPLNVIE